MCEAEGGAAAPSFLSRSSVLLFSCAFLLQSDQNLLAPHLSAVAREFGMSDAERDEKLGGELAMGLFLLGAPAALALGAAADRYSRSRLLVAILVVGGAASVGTAASRSYGALFWWRALTGVSLGASLPVTFSLLADLFPPSLRTSASGRVGIAMSAGAGFGQFVSGFLGAAMGWRVPFVVVGALFLLLAVAVAFAMREPTRGAFDAAAAAADVAKGSDQEDDDDDDEAAILEAGGRDDKPGPSRSTTAKDLKSLARTPTVWLVFLQGIPGCIPWGIIIVFLNDFLHADLGLSVARATTVLSAFTVGGFGGMVVGGEVGQRLHSWRPAAAAGHMAVAEVASVLPLVLILRTARDDANFQVLVALAAVGGLCATQTGPIVRACLQNTVAPRARATAFAVFAIFDDLGKGGGPWILAKLVAKYGRRATFVYATIIGWGAGGLVNAAIALTLDRDERALRGEAKPRGGAKPRAGARKDGDDVGLEMMLPRRGGDDGDPHHADRDGGGDGEVLSALHLSRRTPASAAPT